MYYYKEYSKLKIQNDWVSQNFSGEDIETYYWALNENQKQWQDYIDKGWLQQEIIYESIFVPELNDSIDFEIGVKLTINSGVNPSQLQLQSDYASWLNRLPPEIQVTSPLIIG